MSTWDKNIIWISLAKSTGADETVTHVVQFQPIDQAFSTGAVLGLQSSSKVNRYQPASDLDTTKNYDVHISHSATPTGRIFGINTVTLPEA